MRLFRLVLTGLLILLLLTSVSAAQVDEGLSESISPEEGLSSDTLEAIGSYEEFSTSSFSSALLRLLQDALSGLNGPLRQAISCCGMILAAVLLCGLFDSADGIQKGTAILGAFAITAICTGSLSAMIGLGTQTIDSIDRYTALLLPGMASLCAAAGSTAASSALYIGTAFLLKLLMSLIRVVLLPGIYMLAAISAAEAALDNDRLSKLREFLYWLISGTLKTSLYIFTGFLTVTGVISGTSDAIRIKAAKLALSGTVPVVGGIISDASDTLLTSAVTVKNTLGTYGLLAVLTVCLLPFLQVALQHFSMKLTTALSGLIGKKCHVALVGHLTQAMGLLTAAVGAYSMMVLICITVFLKIGV